MRRLHGMKVIVLTRGDLTDIRLGWSKACCEKSAEAIVLEMKFQEGPNNRRPLVTTGRRIT